MFLNFQNFVKAVDKYCGKSDFENSTVEFIKKASETISYYSGAFVASSVRKVQPPVIARRPLTFNLVIVYACVLLGSVLIACIVNGVMISNSNAKAKKANKRKNEENKEQPAD